MAYNAEHAREILRQRAAFFVENAESRSVPIDNRKEVQIAWVAGNTDEFGAMQQFLQEYTWPDNQTPQRWVDSPRIRGGELSGIWRQAFVTQIHRENRDRRTPELLCVLTLRRGWSESIEWDESLPMEWRERDGNGMAVAGIADTTSIDKASTVVVRFPNIAPDKTQSCLGELAASTFSGITIQGYTSELTWYKAFAIANKTEDGTIAIDLTLTRSLFTIENYQNYGAPRESVGYRIYDVPRATAHLIVEAWKGLGRSADIQLHQDRDLCVVSLWNSSDNEDEFSTLSATSCAFFVMRTNYTNIEAPITVPENSMGITYNGNFGVDPSSGRYSGYIEKRVRQTLHISSYRSRNTHGHYVMTERWEGLYLDGEVYKTASLSVAENDIVISLSDAIALPSNTIEAGETWDVAKSRNEDCTYTIEVNLRTEIGGEIDPYDILDHNYQHDSAIERFNQLSSAITLEAAAGEILRASVSYNKDSGLVDVTEVTSESKPVTDAQVAQAINAFESRLTSLDRNQSASLSVDPSLNENQLEELFSTLNDYQKYDNQRVLRTAIPKSLTVTFATKYGQGTYYWARNQPQGSYQIKLTEMSASGMTTSHQGNLNDFELEDFSIRIQPNENTGVEGADLIFRSLRYEVRPQPEYRRADIKIANGKQLQDQWRFVALIKASKITQTYSNSDNAVKAMWELSELELGTGASRVVYQDLELTQNPSISASQNATGRRMYVATAQYRCLRAIAGAGETPTWIAAYVKFDPTDPASAPVAPPMYLE